MSSKVELTRRALLFGTVAVGGVALAKFAEPRAVAQQSFGLRIVGSTDPEFKELVQQNFPGIWDDEIFQKLISAVFVLSNQSRHRVRAFTAEWNIATATGGFATRLHHFNRPKSRRASNGRTPRVEVSKSG